MQLYRMFSTDRVKGERNYLSSQKKYELLRTLLYFAVSIALFVAGYLQTGSRKNLLTVVAVLGCLPASKSAVSAIMFLRFKSCSDEVAQKIAAHAKGLDGLYDCVFTSEKKNFVIAHLSVRGNTICGYCELQDFDENAFYAHIGNLLCMDGHKDTSVKIFTSLARYTERMEQLKALDGEAVRTQAILATLKSVML